MSLSHGLQSTSCQLKVKLKLVMFSTTASPVISYTQPIDFPFSIQISLKKVFVGPEIRSQIVNLNSTQAPEIDLSLSEK